METIDWTTFTKKIIIDTPMQRVYDSWTTTKNISTWFLKDAVYTASDNQVRTANEYVQEGDTYVWHWYNYDGEERGTVLEANGKDTIVFSFAQDCTVTVKLKEQRGQILLTLTQTDIPTDDFGKYNIYCGCNTGWTFWLANLKAFLEHGILLHDKGISGEEKPDASKYVNS